ncbi:MAG: ComEC/Rec2 family competence protein, partial [Tumebacillaceae bacterium]
AIAAEGIDTIDVMVMTHADEDHVKGLLAVLKRFTVKEVIVSDTTTDKPFYQQLLQEVRNLHIPMKMAQAGQILTPEPGIAITFYNPPARHYRGTDSDTNANSAVFTLQYGKRTFLYTADFEGVLEPKLLIHQPIDVLKVAHHGSPHSTFTPFLQRITPKVAVVSVGAHNHYGHPSKDTLQRLRDIGADIWRTDQQGAIVCETDGESLQVSSWLGTSR